MADVVVFGAGQIAEVAKAYIDAHGPDRVVGFTVDAAYRRSDSFAGLPLVAWEELEARFPPNAVKLLGPISYRRLNAFRRDRHRDGKERGYAFASFIHPGSHVYAAAIGENAFILEGNVIQPFVTIGQGVIMWSGNHVGHHSVIEEYCFIGSHVGIASNVHVGERCFLAPMAGVYPGVTIGAASIVGARATVATDVPAGSVVAPAEPSKIAAVTSDRAQRLL